MRTDIRFAGISATDEQRVRAAVRMLGAYKIRAQASAWEGWGCELVVLDLDDTYGSHVAEIAVRHGLKVIAFGPSHARLPGPITQIPADASARIMSDAMLELIAPDEFARVLASRGATVKPIMVTDAPLGQQSFPWSPLTNALARTDVRATNGARKIYLCRGSSRIQAHTLSDMQFAMRHADAPGWMLARTPGIPEGQAEVSRSLDVFLLNAALQHPERIDAFDDVPFRLSNWPDLAGIESVESLKIASTLSKSEGTVKDIASQLALPEQTVNAHFWAFQAAGLLEQAPAGDRPQLPPKPKVSGILMRLAAHFGLARKPQ